MIVSNQVLLSVVSIYLQLSHHSGVIIPIFILATLQLEGVAEISQPFEFWDILQFTVIHLKIHSHIRLIYSTEEKLLYTLEQ